MESRACCDELIDLFEDAIADRTQRLLADVVEDQPRHPQNHLVVDLMHFRQRGGKRHELVPGRQHVVYRRPRDERATQIVTQKLESLRLCTWAELATYPANFVDYYTPQSTNKGTVYGGTITIASASTFLPSSAGYRDQVKLVTISVNWTNYVSNGNPIVHTRQMQTLAAYWGLQNSLWGNGS